MLRMEFGMVAGVGTVPFGVAILHCLYHVNGGISNVTGQDAPTWPK